MILRSNFHGFEIQFHDLRSCFYGFKIQFEQFRDPIHFLTKTQFQVHTVYPEIFAVIKFGDLPEIWQKCI